ncbi:hypothetical protein L1987_13473 [Smallanthus sonchifolius]|uniref:Uncharacterized protein n=1 Tax=Smallanthus sonchifolius TaxID=185202 RepID=A0ACB9JHN1_9ASTR|nr:hypothetical protein L1987_13473 [Smallanthus sonchifolius]
MPSLICWAEIGDSQLTSPELVFETSEKIVQIRNCMAAVHDRQKGYADKRRKPLEFQIGDMFLFKSLTLEGCNSLREMRQTECPLCWTTQDTDETLIVPLEELQTDEQLQFVEEPVEIMDREIKTLKRSKIPIVRVRWNSKRGPEFTWEREDQMISKYPHLFKQSTSNS